MTDPHTTKQLTWEDATDYLITDYPITDYPITDYLSTGDILLNKQLL